MSTRQDSVVHVKKWLVPTSTTAATHSKYIQQQKDYMYSCIQQYDFIKALQNFIYKCIIVHSENVQRYHEKGRI
jgi:hypothetical protein